MKAKVREIATIKRPVALGEMCYYGERRHIERAKKWIVEKNNLSGLNTGNKLRFILVSCR